MKYIKRSNQKNKLRRKNENNRNIVETKKDHINQLFEEIKTIKKLKV